MLAVAESMLVISQISYKTGNGLLCITIDWFHPLQTGYYRTSHVKA